MLPLNLHVVVVLFQGRTVLHGTNAAMWCRSGIVRLGSAGSSISTVLPMGTPTGTGRMWHTARRHLPAGVLQDSRPPTDLEAVVQHSTGCHHRQRMEALLPVQMPKNDAAVPAGQWRSQVPCRYAVHAW